MVTSTTKQPGEYREIFLGRWNGRVLQYALFLYFLGCRILEREKTRWGVVIVSIYPDLETVALP